MSKSKFCLANFTSLTKLLLKNLGFRNKSETKKFEIRGPQGTTLQIQTKNREIKTLFSDFFQKSNPITVYFSTLWDPGTNLHTQ
jgi:hypothetical protein